MTGWPMRMRHVVIVTHRSFSSESEEKSVQWVLSLVNDELAVESTDAVLAACSLWVRLVRRRDGTERDGTERRCNF
ncbi:hypothetical protein ACFX2I_020698 [Malus domestica]